MKTLRIAVLLAVSAQLATAQTARDCVDRSWAAFKSEIDRVYGGTGDVYLTAYGHAQATEACLSVANYPADLLADVAQFRDGVSRTSDLVEEAIRNNGSPSLFAMGFGAGGSLPTFPQATPGAGGFTGTLTVPNNDAQPSGYRMLSMREIYTIQVKLTRMGYDTGGADGIAGPRTYAAIERYQRDQGARPTGLLNSRQIAALLQ
ncbi:MAG: peptidoglycan-binding domain-containing protein [Pseudomonadota bacterium]